VLRLKANKGVPPKLLIDWWFWATLALQGFLTSQTLFKVLPPTVGFFPYWAKTAERATIYKDFVFPFPPLSLWVEGSIPNLFTNVALAEQTMQAVKWLAIAGVLYQILRTLGFESISSFLGTSISCTAYYCSPGNITAGYLELVWLFLLIATLFALKYVKSEKERSWHAFLAGLFVMCAFLTKQSAIIPLFLMSLAFVYVESINNPRGFRRARTYTFFAGVAVPTLILIVFGLFAGNLGDAVTTIFSGGGKNPFGSLNPFFWLIEGFGLKSPRTPVLLGVAAVVVLLKYRSTRDGGAKSLDSRLLLGSGTALLILCILGSLGLGPLEGTNGTRSASLVVLLAVALGMIIFISEHSPDWRSLGKWQVIVISVYAVLVIFAGTKLVFFDPTSSSWVGTYATYLNEISGLGVIGSFCLLIYDVTQSHRAKRHSAYRQELLIIFMISFGFAIMNVLSAGLGIETWLLILAIVVGIFSRFILSIFATSLGRLAAVAALLIPLVGMSAQQSLVPYEWWGITDDNLTARHEMSPLPGLRGFNLGPNSSEFYGTLNHYLEQAKNESPSPHRLLIGPNITGTLAQVFDETNTYPMTCVIQWWDLCSDKETLADLEKINADLPEAIIWNIAPENVAYGHEWNFRNGNTSGLRLMQDWIKAHANSPAYHVAGEYEVPLSPGSTNDPWRLILLIKN
jgi:hypothetical protein